MFENKKSVCEKLWFVNDPCMHEVHSLIQRYQVPEIIARILVSRGYDEDTSEEFLNPTIRKRLPDPYVLIDMERAVERTYQSILQKQPIVVYGDYDVDGATASSILRRYFECIHYPISLYIPDRFKEGYGANKQALESLVNQGFKLVLMVDCGTNAFEPLENTQKMATDVIVLDHHTAENNLPKCFAIINPNRLDQNLNEREDLKHLCAAGVTFLFIVALNRYLREKGYFKEIIEPNLIQFLDLVALGTVCDVMSLTGLNRAFVAQGLRIMNKKNNLGLSKLISVSGLEGELSCYHLGFVLGPRINAGGRIGCSDLGSKLLTTKNDDEANTIATRLNVLNGERQEIEKQTLEEAIHQVEKNNLHKNPLIMVGKENWHPGIIGIVASRIKDLYNLPSCVVAFNNNEGRGSGRSISGVCLGEIMHAAVHAGLLEKGGGHAMAVGFTVLQRNYEEFYNFLNEKLSKTLVSKTLQLHLEGCITPLCLNLDFVKNLEVLQPFGQGNVTPRFAILHLRLKHKDIVGDTHLRCFFEDETGNVFKVMAFRCVGTKIDKYLEKYKAKGLFHIVGSIKNNRWNNRDSITFVLDDLMMVS